MNLPENHYLYVIALGSNMRDRFLGPPSIILKHAINALEMEDIDVFCVSKIITSRAIGPSQRQFSNAAAIVATDLLPDDLLVRLHQVERHFGRRKMGQKWRARPLDLDIILWSGGIWESRHPMLAIPHFSMTSRHFVLKPASEIAGSWRDPLSNLKIRHLLYQFIRPKRLDPDAAPY